jgi:hypothetical protein
MLSWLIRRATDEHVLTSLELKTGLQIEDFYRYRGAVPELLRELDCEARRLTDELALA